MSSLIDQAAALRQCEAPVQRRGSPGPARALACSSGKGGVGKTFVAVNLAIALHRYGRRVLLVDADLGLANADILLGVSPVYTLQDAVFGSRPLAEVICPTAFGIDLLAASAGSREMVQLGEARLQGMIQELVRFSASYDFLLLDCASGIAPGVLAFVGIAERNLVIATPDPTSMMDVYALTKVIHQRRLAKVVELVINMAESKEEGHRVYQTLRRATQQFLQHHLVLGALIPSSRRAALAVREGRPLIDLEPHDPAAAQIAALARRILTTTAPTEISDPTCAKPLSPLAW